MKPTFVQSYSITALTLILGALGTTPANSQPIKEANDGTNTTVNQNGNQFNIEGGTRNGGNLFHSFDKFNVPTNQTANFLITPDTQNILGRVTGGNASYINGLIQVIGGNSNLFLMNPAGVMFGPNATLNIPASFSVTTATGIGFDSNNYWFQAMGTNDYSNLVGNPSGYKFNVSNPGAIVNEGNLTLNPGENLTLLGGTVINTGELSTAGGNVTIAAVEGGSILRISQPGNLLSLEVNSTTANGEDISGINPLSLAALLTGGETTHATSVIVNDNGDVVLTDSNTFVANTPGDAIVSGNIDVSTTSTSHTSHTPHTSFEGGYNTGSQVNVLGSRVALLNTNINANGTNGGGTVLIGGDFQGNGIVPNSQQTFINNNSIISADAINNGDGGRVIIWSDGITNFAGNISAKGGAISGDGGFVEVSGKQDLIFEGNVNVSAAFGNPGTILLDPENVTVGEDNSETEGDNLELSVTENTDSETEIVENNSEVSSSENSDSNTTENTENSETETAGDNSEISSPENIDSNTTEIADNSETTETETPINPFAQDENADVTISAENLGELSGDVILIADNDITINEKIETDSSVELKAGRSININADIDTSIGNGNIDLFGNNDEMNFANRSNGKASINQLDGTTLNAGSGRINIQLGNLGEVGDINLGSLTTTGEVFVNANGGNIARVSENSLINAGSVLFETSGNGGIGLTNAPLQLNVGNLEAVSGSGGIFFDVGNVNIGGVSEDVDGISTGAGGDIILESTGDVTVTENISTDLFIDGKTGGDINLTTNNLFVLNGAEISASTFAKGNGGSVNITAQDTITFDRGDSENFTGAFTSVSEGAVGDAGDITIQTGSLEVKNGAQISTSTFGKGKTGNVEINATETILFDGGGAEFSSGVFSLVEEGAEANANDSRITIKTGSLEVKNGAEISVDTFGIGDAADVEITATDTILFDGVFKNSRTGTFSSVRVGAVGDAGDITIQTGSLEVKNGAEVSASTSGNGNAGNVEITATDTILLDGVPPGGGRTGVVTIVTDKGKGNAGELTIKTGSLEVKNGIRISSDTFGIGDAGNVEITATDTILFDGVPSNGRFSGAFSSVRVGAEGNAGDITIKTGSLEFKNGAEISATTDGKGDAGDVEITADTILFQGVVPNSRRRAGVANTVREAGEGKAGDITIKTGSLEVKNGARIASQIFGKGDGGNVEITATDTVLFDGLPSNGRSSGAFTSVRDKGVGDAGDITIKTGSLEAKNGAVIDSETLGKGDGGNVEITATDTVLFDGVSSTGSRIKISGASSSVRPEAEGNAGDVSITTGSLEVTNGARISSSTEGKGDAGNIFIRTNSLLKINENASISAVTETKGKGGNVIITAPENLNITGNGEITVSSRGGGNAGQIDIISPNITLSDGIDITAFSESTGNAGIINLEGENINIQPNTRILAFTENEGDGGNIIVKATETLNLDADSQLSVETNRSGKAGNIEINTPQLTIGENAQISATVNIGATTKEPGGNITINTNELNIAGELGIFAETEATAEAGSLTLSPYKTNPNLDITFTNDGFISASTSSTGNGGNINISAPETINIQGNGFIAVETTDIGNAGTINIDTKNLTLSDQVAISASTEDKGNAGVININTNNLTLETGTSLTTETNDAGKAGEIEINTRQLTIGENAQISATAREGATNTEAGGNITINATDLFISGRLGIFAETAGESPAGTLTLNPYRNNPNLNITFTELGFISARTTSIGDGGNINIFAPENIDISGEGKISVETTGSGDAGTINIQTENLNLSDQVAISAETNSSGTAGNIVINSQTLTIGKDTEISATAKKEATSTEEGGNITINTNDLLISGRLGIFAETEGKANAGTLTINPYREGDPPLAPPPPRRGDGDPNLNITFTENGFISARTLSTGDGGNINIFAPEEINISGEGRITVETEGAGNAGIINIETENLTIAENTTISAATSDSGDGGSININPSQTFQLEGQILTETTGAGNGGTITINTGEMTAPNSTISAKSTNSGNAGEINISAENNITTGIITSEANNITETADGGNISITSEQGEINATQAIQSFSNQGNAGDVTLTAQNNITTNTISSHGQQQGGQITITSETGNIDTSTSNDSILANYSGGGNGGNVTLTAPQGNITTNDIYSFADGDGGQITLQAGGNINIKENSNIISASEPPEEEGERGSGGVGRGGDIILEAGNKINTTIAEIYSGADIGDTGKIDIIAEEAIETGEINLASGFVRDRVTVNENFTLIPIPAEDATQGVAGDITLKSNNSTIDTTAGTINSRSPDGTGNISLNARENITTGKLEASALNQNQPTRGGDVEIISQQGEINATQEIETFSQQGTAGNVNIRAESSVNIENILSQGTQRGGDITIDSRSENSINAQGTLNTFSDAGTAGDVTLTSPGNITISGIRSQGMEQGGEIIVNSEIGNIDSNNGNIDSFSEQGIGGNVTLTAPESVTQANVSSFGATESGDLIIQSRTATVNTDNVTTQAPAGSSGSIIINGTEVGTGDLSSIGTTSAGEINVEATDGSITTYDIEISSDGTIGDLTLRATEDVTTEDINQNAGEGDANANIDSGENQTTGDINQTAENDTNINQTAGEDINTEDINQTAGNDTNINQTVGDDLNTGDINQTAGNDTNINQTAGEDINTGDINQTAGNDTNINQTAGEDINTGDINQTAGNDTNINQTAGDDLNTGDINQTAGNDTNINQTAGGDINTPVINQTAGNDTNINQTAGGDINTPVINQTAGNNTNNIQTAGENINTPVINQPPGNNTNNIQTAGENINTPVINPNSGNESINIQNEGVNQNTDNTSVISNNNNSIINPIINQNNPQNNTNTPNNTTTNFGETNILSTTTTSDIIATATPSNNNQTTNTATAQEQTDSSINNTTDTQQILNIIDTVNTNSLTVATGSDQVITMLEQNRIQEYSDYFGEDFNEKLVNTQNVRDILTDMANQTGKESAVVYINSYSDQLQIILYTKSGQPIIKTIPAANRKKLIKVALKLRAHITNPVGRFTNNYLSAAQQLYDWLIAPISAELELANIDTLLFSLDEGLRTFPVAVLHDGSQFLIEKYSLSLIPSVSLMDTNYRPLQDTQVLAMGASEFMKQEPLPAVPIEIQTISEQLWQGTQFLNEEFTRNNLLNERKNYPYPIIHLATHAEFLPGKASNSYIQLWGNEQIKLDQVRELGWSQPAVDLLVLSACRTALGDKNAELGFAGLAVAAGVKSALASLWYVSDEGSLGLMTEFYTHLNNAKIKAEALRQAQLAMLRGEVVIVEGELRGSGARGVVVLPSALGKFENQNLSHPYYWAGFTMVGSPW